MNPHAMPMYYRSTALLCAALLALAASLPLHAQQAALQSPTEAFGFEPGADYMLATYDQMIGFYEQLDSLSERVQLTEIGTSVLGRPMLLMLISSEENLARLDRLRQISEELGRARIDEDRARELAGEGKAIVWIDGGMHATEKAHAQMTPELAYRVATEESEEMQKIRENVVLLLMPVMNPDGLDIVVEWYQAYRGTPFETTNPAWLYHHYVGHDNNRDWFMNNMPESEAVSRVLYNEWYPQIVYNHHQTSPPWARIFIPPFSDPVNPNIHPGVTTGVNLVGTAIANRFAMENMPGVVSDYRYDMWWNGGMRTAPYYHNMIGILTETAHATPTPRYYSPDSVPAQLGYGDDGGFGQKRTDGTNIFYPNPWKGGESHFRDAVDYMLTASMAVLDIAADRPDTWLFNFYKMGRAAIEKADLEGPFAYVVPAEQWDEGEALALISTLRKTGIEVHRARSGFNADGTPYPAGSFVLFTAQAFRPMLVDLLEPQVYPNLVDASGQPEMPYDIAGWTLPEQMGVQVDRITDAFEADLTEVTDVHLTPDPGRLAGPTDDVFGFAFSHQPNAAALAVNRLLAAGDPVAWAGGAFSGDGSADSTAGAAFPTGTIVVLSAESATRQRLETLTRELGLDVTALPAEPEVTLHALKRPRIALYKSWVANMDEGWTRWLLESYEFQVDTLHDADLQTADLSAYDAVLLPSQDPEDLLNGHTSNTMPEAFTGGMGLQGALALKSYVEGGGTLVALDEASDFAIEQFGLPVRNVVDGTTPQQFFIPGSLIRAEVNTNHPLAYGMQEEIAASFQRSRAFETVQQSRMGEGGREEIAAAPAPPVEVVVRYAEEELLMSGWALGEERIAGQGAMVNVRMGAGNVVLFGFRPQFRGQPRGSYKLLLNALQGATLEQLPVMETDAAPLPSPQRP